MEKPVLKGEDKRLWSLITATVRPHFTRFNKSKSQQTEAKPVELAKSNEFEIIKISGMPDMIAPRIVSHDLPALPPKLETIRPKIHHELKLRQKLAFETDRFEPDPIEPKRKRRLTRERDRLEAVLDLHGLTTISAEVRLKAFVEQAYANDFRSILVITGKGMAKGGDGIGVLKRMTPQWLAAPELIHMVAGISDAHAKHGGFGALYVALKRRSI